MEKAQKGRAGVFKKAKADSFATIQTEYFAFAPAKLPPAPPIFFDAEMQKLLSSAERSLGRLSGVASILPNPAWILKRHFYGLSTLTWTESLSPFF